MKRAKWERKVTLVHDGKGNLSLSLRVMWPKKLRKGKETGSVLSLKIADQDLTLALLRATERPETTCPRWKQPLLTDPKVPPKVGDEVYVPTKIYIDRGQDDVDGGIATVVEVKPGISGGKPTSYVTVKEHPGCGYNWEFLALEQEKHAKEFGQERAKRNPDVR